MLRRVALLAVLASGALGRSKMMRSSSDFAVPERSPEIFLLEEQSKHKESQSDKSAVRVMTYNIWNFDDGPRWGDRKKIIARTVKEQGFPEVIAFQELRRDNAGHDMFADLKSLLAPQGYHGTYMPAMDYDDDTEGLGVFSRLAFRRPTAPNSGVTAQHLHLNSRGGDLNKRVVVHVPLATADGKPLHVFATHFSYSRTEQDENAEGVLAFARGVLSGDRKMDAAVLLGDFNVLPQDQDGEEPMRLLESSDLGFKDSWATLHPSGEATALLSSEHRRAELSAGSTFCNCKMSAADQESCTGKGRIDRIFFRGGPGFQVTASVVGAMGPQLLAGDGTKSAELLCASDHRPVISTFRI